MDIFLIIVLLLAAVLFFLIELFIVPGISVAGFIAGGCVVYANYYAFTHLGDVGGWITLAISIIGCIGSVVLFMRSKTLDRIALKKNITSKIDRPTDDNLLRIGDTGITTTRLALIGYADVHGYIIEVKSDDGFINEKTPIEVVRIKDGIIFVKETK